MSEPTTSPAPASGDDDGPRPLGSTRCIEMLVELTGLDITYDDFDSLVDQGHIAQVGYYKKWPLYDTSAVARLGSTEEGRSIVAAVIESRIVWLANSLTTQEAADRLGWSSRDLIRVGHDRDVEHGRDGRWSTSAIDAFAADEALCEQVHREQRLGPDQAAEYLEVRRTDFNYVVAAGWVAPVEWVTSSVTRHKEVDVPLYLVGDLDDLRDIPGVDWEAVRDVKPGEPSPLRERTALPKARADAIRIFCGEYGADHEVALDPRFRVRGREEWWEIRWVTRADGHPTAAEVAGALASHRHAAKHADGVRLAPSPAHEQRSSRGGAAT